MNGKPAIQPGYTYRSSDGRARSTYDPSWSASKPWSVIVDGTVRSYAYSLDAAKQRFRELGVRGVK